MSAGVPASVEVSAGSSHPPEILQTVYTCWLDALAHAGAAPRAISVREDDAALMFEVVRDALPRGRSSTRLRDRVEALGGRLTIRAEPGGDVRDLRLAAALALS